ncbi:hypothetical protein RI367_000762 [Sorochytrium milnesiophthora]
MSGRVSTGAKKTGQKYKNTTAFRHNPGSKLTKKILALPVQGLCSRCFEIIEWRKKYRKYKPLTAPKKCVGCEQKTVKDAYHVICDKCAGARGVCAKCQESREIVASVNTETSAHSNKTQQEFEAKLQRLSERQRRTFLRRLERGDVTQQDLLDKALSDDDEDDDFWGADDDEGDEDSEDDE